MNPLDSFLEKFKAALSLRPDKKFILEKIKIITGADLEEKNIEVKDSVLYIQASSIVKNTLFIKKSLILKAFQGNISTQKIKDIR